MPHRDHPGPVTFNEALPLDLPYVNEVVTKKIAGDIVNRCTDQFPRWQVVEVLDAMKDLGYRNATRAGVTVAISDVETPDLKAEVLSASEERAAKIEKQFSRGVITDSERAGADRDLDRGDVQGRGRDGGELHPHQPVLRDGQLGCPRQHDPAAADRRHAWAGRQPEG
jgi:hypothetical protein